MAKSVAKKFVIPKQLAQCADLLYETREARLALQKDVDALEDQEKQLREHIINNLPKSQATGVAGKVARATIVMKIVPQVQDWDKFYAHIKKTGDFELMQKRIGTKAIEERWENKKKVPGVEPFNAVTVSLNKV